jgi:hypothetical protein
VDALDKQIQRAAARRLQPELGCLTPEELEAFYAGRAPAPRAEEIRRHLASCAACLEAARELCVLLGTQAPREAGPWRAASGLRRAALPLAAAVVLGVSAGVFWRLDGTGRRAALTRGGGGEPALEAIAPQGELKQRPRSLEWRPAAPGDEYEVEIRDVRLIVVWTRSGLRESRVSIPESLPLAAGRDYAWRVIAHRPDGNRLASPFVPFRWIGE